MSRLSKDIDPAFQGAGTKGYPYKQISFASSLHITCAVSPYKFTILLIRGILLVDFPFQFARLIPIGVTGLSL